MIRIPITGTGTRRAVDTVAFGRRIVLDFGWNERAAAWFVTVRDGAGAQQGAERLAENGAVVANCYDAAGALVGRLAMVDLDPDAGVIDARDLGARLQVYGLTAAELASVEPAFTLSTVASVEE